MPACLVEEQDGMAAWRHSSGGFGKVKVHRLDVAGRQDESGTLALRGTNGVKDIGRRCPLILWRGGPGATNQISIMWAEIPPLLRDLRQLRRECFLKSSTAPLACA